MSHNTNEVRPKRHIIEEKIYIYIYIYIVKKDGLAEQNLIKLIRSVNERLQITLAITQRLKNLHHFGMDLK
jgi:hypothetical protein